MRDNTVEDTQGRAPTGSKPDGMRHSIRPRRRSVGLSTATDDIEDHSKVFTLKKRIDPMDMETAEVPEPAKVTAAPNKIAPQPAQRDVIAEPQLPRWHQLAKLHSSDRVGKGPSLPVVDAKRDTATVRAFDLLRTRLRQTTQEHGWTNIAVCAPTSGCGTTFTTVNLALSLSRVPDSRTVLMDFNLRDPGVAKALDMRARGSMAEFLTGRLSMNAHIHRVSETLALGLNNRVEENAADTLQTPETTRTMERMRAALQPELILYDMPAMLAYDDLSAFVPQLDAVLLVSDGTKTMARDLAECERRLDGKVPLLGVVLNRARKDSIKKYA